MQLRMVGCAKAGNAGSESRRSIPENTKSYVRAFLDAKEAAFVVLPRKNKTNGRRARLGRFDESITDGRLRRARKMAPPVPFRTIDFCSFPVAVRGKRIRSHSFEIGKNDRFVRDATGVNASKNEIEQISKASRRGAPVERDPLADDKYSTYCTLGSRCV